MTQSNEFHPPIWDRGEPIDAEMMRFTIGDDWRQDRRLVEHDIRGSIAHARGLVRAELLSADDGEAIARGLEELLAAHRRGEWNVESGDEDVHSAVERRLIEAIGEPGKRLHTGRSRNDQVALDMRLWLRGAVTKARGAARSLGAALEELERKHGELPLPGYTHLRRAMPSSVGLWAHAHRAALALSDSAFAELEARIARCPLGSGAGYGVPLPLDRLGVARELGFQGPEEPVTLAQNSRGRAELAYLTGLEALALDLGKLAFDLWLFTSEEFGFVSLPVELTTGSSMMPQKRNPDVVELLRAQTRQIVADRGSLLAVLRDLSSGYHRDFQLLKPPLFSAHDRAQACLSIATRLVRGLSFDRDALERAAQDPHLSATERALDEARSGVPFRDAYRSESQARH